MRTPEEFDEIRPYDPEELPAVFEELIQDAEFKSVVEQVMPQIPFEIATQQLRQCHTNLEVQKTFFYPLIKDLLSKCSKGFCMDCSKITDKETPHTFNTIHRYIVLDSSILSVALVDNEFPTTVEIAIGDNLLIRPWIK